MNNETKLQQKVKYDEQEKIVLAPTFQEAIKTFIAERTGRTNNQAASEVALSLNIPPYVLQDALHGQSLGTEVCHDLSQDEGWQRNIFWDIEEFWKQIREHTHLRVLHQEMQRNSTLNIKEYLQQSIKARPFRVYPHQNYANLMNISLTKLNAVLDKSDFLTKDECERISKGDEWHTNIVWTLQQRS